MKHFNDMTKEELIEYIWEYAIDHPDGFTIDLDTLWPIEKGIVASYKETQKHLTKESISKVIDHALANDHIIGGWRYNIDYYFDSCKLFNDDQLDEAKEFGILNEQHAIYDLTNYKTINI